MKPYLTTVLWVCIVIIPAGVHAQKIATPGPQAAAISTGATPVAALPAGEASPAVIEGQPIERRPPEKSDDSPAFPEQTRAPFHASAPFRITTLIDNLPAPWSLAFLPDGKILLT